MYVDIDSSGKYSIMELSDEQISIMSEALVRFACCPSKIKSLRNQAKHLAIKLSQHHDHNQHTDKPDPC